MTGGLVNQDSQIIGLAVLIGIAAILLGYFLRLKVPNKHFPCTAGLIASNAFVAALAYAGVTPAGMMLVGWLTVSFFVFIILFRVDLCLLE